MKAPFIIGEGKAAVRVGGPELFFIAGPCVIESRDSALAHAESLARTAEEAQVGLVFKASYDKANRTSSASFRGPGPKEGLDILAEVRRATGLPLLTDVHECAQVEAVAEVVDVVQIPAFLCRQTDLIQAAARSGRAVNVKKGQFLAPTDMRHVVDKAREAGARKLMVTERGTTFGYGNLVSDMRSLEIMRELEAAVVFDATHSVQLPGAGRGESSGERRFVAPLARAAVAVGVDGVFIEVHHRPEQALSDGANAYPLDGVAALVKALKAIHAAVATEREASE